MAEVSRELLSEKYREACARSAVVDVTSALTVEQLLNALDTTWRVRWLATQVRDALAVDARLAGATWQQIADVLRVERQVAWRKYRNRAS